MPLTVEWVDGLREPQEKPNPKYPIGMDVDMSNGAVSTCSTALPYPAKRCGTFIIECETCGLRVGITTAGRIDDPRSVKVACKRRPH